MKSIVDTTTPKKYFESMNLDVLPENIREYIKNEILTDDDISYIKIDDDSMSALIKLIDQKFPRATHSLSPHEHLDDVIKNLEKQGGRTEDINALRIAKNYLPNEEFAKGGNIGKIKRFYFKDGSGFVVRLDEVDGKPTPVLVNTIQQRSVPSILMDKKSLAEIALDKGKEENIGFDQVLARLVQKNVVTYGKGGSTYAGGGEVEYTEDDYEDYLNELGGIYDYDSDKWIIGGEHRYDETQGNYGEALRKYDPVGFSVGFREWVENNFAKGGSMPHNQKMDIKYLSQEKHEQDYYKKHGRSYPEKMQEGGSVAKETSKDFSYLELFRNPIDPNEILASTSTKELIKFSGGNKHIVKQGVPVVIDKYGIEHDNVTIDERLNIYRGIIFLNKFSEKHFDIRATSYEDASEIGKLWWDSDFNDLYLVEEGDSTYADGGQVEDATNKINSVLANDSLVPADKIAEIKKIVIPVATDRKSKFARILEIANTSSMPSVSRLKMIDKINHRKYKDGGCTCGECIFCMSGGSMPHNQVMDQRYLSKEKHEQAYHKKHGRKSAKTYKEKGGELYENEIPYYFEFYEERGFVDFRVENENFETVWSIEDVQGFIEQGWIKNVEDVDGLEKYLKSMNIIPHNAVLYSNLDEYDEAVDQYETKKIIKPILDSLSNDRFSLREGKRKWHDFEVIVTKLIWERNYYDGWEINIYKDGNHITTIKWDGDDIEFNEYAKGGSMPHNQVMDQRYLSKEKHEQAYHKKHGRKSAKTYKEKGGWIQEATTEMEKKGTVGSFTKEARKYGLSPIDYAKEVLANPNNYDETTRKRAQFVKNANPDLFKEGGEMPHNQEMDSRYLSKEKHEQEYHKKHNRKSVKRYKKENGGETYPFEQYTEEEMTSMIFEAGDKNKLRLIVDLEESGDYDKDARMWNIDEIVYKKGKSKYDLAKLFVIKFPYNEEDWEDEDYYAKGGSMPHNQEMDSRYLSKEKHEQTYHKKHGRKSVKRYKMEEGGNVDGDTPYDRLPENRKRQIAFQYWQDQESKDDSMYYNADGERDITEMMEDFTVSMNLFSGNKINTDIESEIIDFAVDYNDRY